MCWVVIPIGLVLAPSASAAAPTRPNLLVILTDDQRFDALGFNGNARIYTPHLDRLAARSVRFTNASVVMALCSPSRAAILTGRYGSANGVTSLDAPLRAGETTVAQVLKSAGYRTGFSGKWHIGGAPQDVGFEFACYFRGNGTYLRRQVWDNGTELRPEAHIDDYCVDRSIAFLEDAAKRPEPFLLFHNTQLPHMDDRLAWPSPDRFRDRYDPAQLPLPPTVAGDLTGKPPYLEHVRNRTQADHYGYRDPRNVREHIRDYYAVVTQMDAIVGRLLDRLDRLGLREKTWIVFMSDNGWLLGEHRMTSKVLAYAPSVRVPLLVAAPGVRAREEARLALNIDIAPTLLELAGVPVPATMQGASLVPVVSGEDGRAWRESFVYECLDGYGGTRPMLASLTDRWSLIQTWDTRADVGSAKRPFTELYDRRADPAEARNLAAEPTYAEIVRRLESKLRQHVAKLGLENTKGERAE